MEKDLCTVGKPTIQVTSPSPHYTRLFSPIDASRSRESANVYAVGLFNTGAAYALVVPFAILLRDSFKARRCVTRLPTVTAGTL